MLEAEALRASYGRAEVLRDVGVQVAPGEVVAVVGPNGAGKTTLLRVLSGLLPARSGRVLLNGREITATAAEARVGLGLSLVPEGREVFTSLTVRKNLEMGAYHRLRRGRGAEIASDLEEIWAMFPVLRERAWQLAGSLSGGEQQMLAIGRALMARPRLLLLDEPSLGLSPLLVTEILRIIAALRERGLGCLMVEQNVQAVLRMADRAYVLQGGRIVAHGSGESLVNDPKTVSLYLRGRATSLSESSGEPWRTETSANS
ncbi:MAG: ABC transporter ATP-binding protein [Deltaproteobacteria bacterium]|nr:ABC transporter ATP-binding protein [Deltaproteobacteria bacterium]